MKKEKRRCVGCRAILTCRYKIKYCTNKCQINYQYRTFIEDWKNGLISGGVGCITRTLSWHIRRYLAEKYKEKCSLCGWSQRHSITGKVPLEIDHIDGNAENNKEENLRLICPNCHALTPHFRALNTGKGRAWRMDRYYAKGQENRNEIYFVNVPQRRV